MYYKWLSLLIALAAAACLTGCGGGGGTTLSPTTTTADQTLGTDTSSVVPASMTIKLALFGNLRYCPESMQQRYGLYVGGDHEAAEVAAFKSNNPTALVFVYQCAAVAEEVPYAVEGTSLYPISYYWVNENRPEWFLTDADGERIQHEGYPTNWVVDPAIDEYHQRFVTTAIERARIMGADGVKIDGVGYHMDWGFTAIPTQYPTNEAYAEAMGSFVHSVGPAIRAAGLIVIGNGSSENWISSPWSDWITYLDGREYENEATYDSEQHWRDLFEGYTSLPDKLYVHYLPNPDTYPELFRFKLASFMLWMGPNSYAACPFSTGAPIYDPLLDVSIGQPTGQCAKIGTTTYHRTFEAGELFINISATSSEAVQVGAGLRDVSTGPVTAGSVTLAPHQSLILARG